MAEPARSLNSIEPERLPDQTLRTFLGYRLKRSYNVVRADLVTVLEPFGFRVITFSALAVILDQPMLRHSELADILSLERPNLVPVISGLLEQELIKRHAVAEDRRACAFSATDKGAKLFRQAAEAVKRHETRMFQRLTDSEQAQLASLLNKIEQPSGED